MKNYCVLCCLCCCFFITACASTASDSKPVWIDNAQSLYAENDYLSAVGQGSTRQRATKNAIANLASIAYVHVRAETNTLTEATKAQSVLGVTLESSTSLQRNVQTKTDQALSGVKIKHSWLSPAGEYYALALLDKRSAALSLHESIMALDQSTAQLLQYSAQGAPNSIVSLNALREARDEQLARQMANLQLKQVSVSGIATPISSKQIERRIAEKLASLQMMVNIEAPNHAKTVQAGLAQLGIRVVESANIEVRAEHDITEPTLLNGWYWVRGSYQLSIIENGLVISRKRWPITISAKQEALLAQRVRDHVAGHMRDYLAQLLSDAPAL